MSYLRLKLLFDLIRTAKLCILLTCFVLLSKGGAGSGRKVILNTPLIGHDNFFRRFSHCYRNGTFCAC